MPRHPSSLFSGRNPAPCANTPSVAASGSLTRRATASENITKANQVKALLSELNLEDVANLAETSWTDRVNDSWFSELKDRLSEAEAFAILAFTVETEFTLYDALRTPSSCPLQTELQQIRTLITDGVRKLDVARCNAAHRGLQVPDGQGELNDAYRGVKWNKGEEICFDRLSSFSESFATASAFAGGLAARGIVLKVVSATFRDIRLLSAHPDEQELIEVPPKRYTVISREHVYHKNLVIITAHGSELHFDVLQQVPKLSSCGPRDVTPHTSTPAECQGEPAKGATLLTIAVERGNLDLCKVLLESQKADPSLRDGRGITPLNIAVAKGNHDIVGLLLQCGAAADGENKDGTRPLHIAGSTEQIGVVQLLLQHGADPDHEHLAGNTPLHAAAMRMMISFTFAGDWRPVLERHSEIVGFSLCHGFSKLLGIPGYFVRVRDIRIGSLVVDFEVSGALCTVVEARLDIVTRDRVAVAAAFKELAEVAGFAVELRHATHAPGRSTPNLEMCELLLCFGAEVNAQNDDGATPLWIAAERGETKLCRLLLAYGADVNVRNRNDMRAIDIATQMGHSSICDLLLKFTDVEAEDGFPEPPQGEQLDEQTHVSTPGYGQDPLGDDTGGTNPFQTVNSSGQTGSAMLLAERRAQQLRLHHGEQQVSTVSSSGPSNVASSDSSGSANSTLSAESVGVKGSGKEGANRLSNAVQRGNVEICTVLLGEAETNASRRDDRGFTPLNIAVAKGDLEIVHLLLQHGADADGDDEDGTRPLHIAVWTGQTGIVRLLLEHGVRFGVPLQAPCGSPRSMLTFAFAGNWRPVVERATDVIGVSLCHGLEKLLGVPGNIVASKVSQL